MDKKARIGLLSGDACGIGPEIIAKMLADGEVFSHADVLLIGDERIFQRGAKIANTPLYYDVIHSSVKIDFRGRPLLLLDRGNIDPDRAGMGEVNAMVGKAMLDDLTMAMNLVQSGQLDALCFAPLNKQALHAGGNPYEDELHYFATHLGVENYSCEINVMDGIWTTRATSHVALKDIFNLLTEDRIFQAIRMAHTAMTGAGVEQPEILVSALNPHGGEGGLFGDEEERIIVPAIEKARISGISANGPFPADTIFLKTIDRKPVGVVSMYHDQGQVALKLMGFKRGVTVQGGLPLPITTPAHGTAFDIAGKGIADPQTIRLAFDLAVEMGLKRRCKQN